MQRGVAPSHFALATWLPGRYHLHLTGGRQVAISVWQTDNTDDTDYTDDTESTESKESTESTESTTYFWDTFVILLVILL